VNYADLAYTPASSEYAPPKKSRYAAALYRRADSVELSKLGQEVHAFWHAGFMDRRELMRRLCNRLLSRLDESDSLAAGATTHASQLIEKARNSAHTALRVEEALLWHALWGALFLFSAEHDLEAECRREDGAYAYYPLMQLEGLMLRQKGNALLPRKGVDPVALAKHKALYLSKRGTVLGWQKQAAGDFKMSARQIGRIDKQT